MLANLKFEMGRKSITNQMIANELGLRIQAVILKVNGKTEFKFSEAAKVRDKFFPGMRLEYLFNPEKLAS